MSFEERVKDWIPKIWALIERMIHDVHDREDVFQEVMRRAFAGYTKFRGESSFGTWLYRIAINEIRRYHRRNSPLLPLEETIPASDDPEGEVARKEEIERVREIMNTLPPRYKEILVLRYFQELSYEEIARILKIPVGTVRSRLSRAREELTRRFYEA